MKAVGYHQAGSLDRVDALLDLELPMPEPEPGDVRVKVAAVSVNPVDTKMRKARQPAPGGVEVLGWDAVGTVDAVGVEVRQFKPGDRVYYAGEASRPGCNAEYQVVDARLVAHAPARLADTEVAAMPLTLLTAWEMLFDRLGVPEGGGKGQTLLVVGAAGGVGSILVQLARQLTQLTVIATASRPETQSWVTTLGAHHVINHHQSLAQQLQELGITEIDRIAALTHSEQHWPALVELVAPYGRIALIDELSQLVDLMPLKRKSVSIHWEYMFAAPLFDRPHMQRHGAILARAAVLLDQGVLKSTLTETLSPVNAANLKQAHRLLEAGQLRGKLVLSGF